MMRFWSASVEAAELGGGVLAGEGQAFAVGEVGAEDDRFDAHFGHDPLHVLLGVGGDDEVLAEDFRGARGPAGRCRPIWLCGPSGRRGPFCAGRKEAIPCPSRTGRL